MQELLFYLLCVSLEETRRKSQANLQWDLNPGPQVLKSNSLSLAPTTISLFDKTNCSNFVRLFLFLFLFFFLSLSLSLYFPFSHRSEFQDLLIQLHPNDLGSSSDFFQHRLIRRITETARPDIEAKYFSSSLRGRRSSAVV